MGATVLSTVDCDADAAEEVSDPASGVPHGSPSGFPGSRPERPQLRSLPTGRAADRARRSVVAPLRLTRFARLTVTMTTLAVVIALGVGLSSQLASATTSTRPVTVDQGQTLSQIALHERPDLSVHEGVLALQLANGLSTEQIHAGQRLVVPAP